MPSIRPISLPCKPIAVYAYIDRMVIRLRQPMNTAELGQLRCRVHLDGSHGQQRCELYQPKRQALQRLEKRNDLHIGYGEVSLDLVFDEAVDRDAARDFFNVHIVKKYHRPSQGIRFAKDTRYTGPRKAQTNLAIYSDQPCKVTGEAYCLHLDWRMNRAALRRCGLTSISDFIALDYQKFWQQRLLLCRIDAERLGRYRDNTLKKTRRRTRWTKDSINIDLLTGNAIIRGWDSAGNCPVQAVVDGCRPWLGSYGLKKCVIPIGWEWNQEWINLMMQP